MSDNYQAPNPPIPDNPQYNQNYRPTPDTKSSFSMAALLLGGIALLTLCMVVPPLIIAPLGILMAILSRGGSRKIPSSSKIAIVLCTAALSLSVAYTSYMAVTVIPAIDWGAYNELLDKYSEGTLTQEEYNEFLENLLNSTGP